MLGYDLSIYEIMPLEVVLFHLKNKKKGDEKIKNKKK